MDVDNGMPELNALVPYYAEKGGALWMAEDSGAIAAGEHLILAGWQATRWIVTCVQWKRCSSRNTGELLTDPWADRTA